MQILSQETLSQVLTPLLLLMLTDVLQLLLFQSVNRLCSLLLQLQRMCCALAVTPELLPQFTPEAQEHLLTHGLHLEEQVQVQLR